MPEYIAHNMTIISNKIRWPNLVSGHLITYSDKSLIFIDKTGLLYVHTYLDICISRCVVYYPLAFIKTVAEYSC